MDTPVPDGPNARFKRRDVAGSAFADAAAADLAANAADLALLIDHRGVIRDAACTGDEFDAEELEVWIGKKWVDLVAKDSRSKVELLLDPVASQNPRRWRHVNHLRAGDADLPIRFFTLPSGREGWTVAIGRDLRAASSMQQRLIEAQRTMERDYARVREAETRFRLLFQLATKGVLIVDGDTFKITDVNPSAARILGRPAPRLEGRGIDAALGETAARHLRETMAVARKTGRAERIDITPDGCESACSAMVSVYRQGRDVYFLVRLAPVVDSAEMAVDGPMAQLAYMLPDGLVLTGEDGRIMAVNAAFVEIAHLPSQEAAIGQPAGQLLGRTETEINVLMANLREHGAIRNFACTVRTPQGLYEAVEISAVTAPGPSGPVYGFSVRPVGRKLVAGRRPDGGALPSTVEQLSDLVGRVALKDIVRESTDMIERSCIEAALELTNDNRASAAELLGLSRQSLYAKMHRHKIGELPGHSDA